MSPARSQNPPPRWPASYERYQSAERRSQRGRSRSGAGATAASGACAHQCLRGVRRAAKPGRRQQAHHNLLKKADSEIVMLSKRRAGRTTLAPHSGTRPRRARAVPQGRLQRIARHAGRHTRGRRCLFQRRHGHGRRSRRSAQPSGPAPDTASKHDRGRGHREAGAVKLAILDRDGVINEDSDAFIKSPEEWQAIPGSLDAIARLSRAGWRVVVATNQSGLARGLFYRAIHARMRRELLRRRHAKSTPSSFAHGPSDGCRCKPTGLFRQYPMQHKPGRTAVGDSLRVFGDTALQLHTRLVRTNRGHALQVAGPPARVCSLSAVDRRTADRRLTWRGSHSLQIFWSSPSSVRNRVPDLDAAAALITLSAHRRMAAACDLGREGDSGAALAVKGWENLPADPPSCCQAPVCWETMSCHICAQRLLRIQRELHRILFGWGWRCCFPSTVRVAATRSSR